LRVGVKIFWPDLLSGFSLSAASSYCSRAQLRVDLSRLQRFDQVLLVGRGDLWRKLSEKEKKKNCVKSRVGYLGKLRYPQDSERERAIFREIRGCEDIRRAEEIERCEEIGRFDEI